MARSERSLTRHPQSRLRALVVDDEKQSLKYFGDILREERIVTSLVATAEDALEEYKWNDVAIVDLKLPKKSGSELAREILIEHPSKWIMFVTGHEELKKLAEEDGISHQGLYDKPLVGKELEALLSKLGVLQDTVALYGALLSGLREHLLLAKEADRDIVERQESLLDAKLVFQDRLLPNLLTRSSERKQIGLMYKLAIGSLSFFPSKRSRLVAPEERHLDALLEIVDILGLLHIAPGEKVQINERLHSIGLGASLEIEELEEFWREPES